MTASEVKKTVLRYVNPSKAKIYLRFFKTGKGEYGEGDRFLGLTTPEIQEIVKRYRTLSLSEIQKLLKSPYHEHRNVGISILVTQYVKATPEQREVIFNFYLNNFVAINNWDLVDMSAPKITGEFIFTHKSKLPLLTQWTESKSIWIRRIAVMSTFAFIRKGEYRPTLILCKKLLNDPEDLIHKATGWMLREIGKRDIDVLINFLDQFTLKMPRTMLRYAIEKLPEHQRKKYLTKKI